MIKLKKKFQIYYFNIYLYIIYYSSNYFLLNLLVNRVNEVF